MIRKTLLLVFMLILFLSGNHDVSALNHEETPSGIPFQEIEGFIDEYMAQYIGETSPGAAVALVKNDEIIFSKGYGYADIGQGIEVDAKETVFEYGSVSKLFVYTAIMRLVEEDKIDLTEDIRTYLPPNFLKKLKFDDPITMLDIMNHTTGFEDYLFDIILTTTDKLSSMEEILREAQPLQVYRPGTISAYSNYAVALAAYIAEQIIGQDFYAYLMETVFLPLNMNDTSAHPLLSDKPELMEKRADGYFQVEGGGFESGGWSYIPLYPVGSVNGTVEDLARYAMALMPDENKESPLFVHSATLEEMLTQTHPMGPGLSGFAHGFIEWDGEYRGLGHGGNTAYFSSQFNFVPEERFGVVVLSNAANEMEITSGLTEALIGRRNHHVSMGIGTLPDAKEVEGVYVGARKMYSSFLDLYGYLSLLNVRALQDNTIEMSMAGQTSILVQTEPYVFERTEADGAIFKYHFGTVYFDVKDGEVQRLSGDFIPLPPGRTMPWLIASLAVAVLSAVYFLLAPLVLFFTGLRRKKHGSSESSQGMMLSKFHTLLVLSGTLTVVNVGVLVIRMLSNNYRSFSEIKIHILLNYPLIILAFILAVITGIYWKRAKPPGSRKAFYAATVIMIFLLMSLLINWKFFSIVA